MLYVSGSASTKFVCPVDEEESGVNCTFSTSAACNYTIAIMQGMHAWNYKSQFTHGKNLPIVDVSGTPYGKLVFKTEKDDTFFIFKKMVKGKMSCSVCTEVLIELNVPIISKKN